MSELVPVIDCPVCTGDILDRVFINRRLGESISLNAIADELLPRGRALSRHELNRHLRVCCGGDRDRAYSESTRESALMRAEAAPATGQDFAVLVRDEAVRRLERGELLVTATHGLAAQTILDRRAEKAADREVAVTLARLLSRMGTVPPERLLVGPETIEGEAVEVGDPG